MTENDKLILKSILTTLNGAIYTNMKDISEINGGLTDERREEIEGYKRSLQELLDDKLFSGK